MAVRKITVVLSQTRSKNPTQRHIEEEIAAALIVQPGVDFAVVPHLYDLKPSHTGMLFLQSIRGDMVVLSWLYPRACRWLLDRNGVKGKAGRTLLGEPEPETDEPTGGIGALGVPDRKIFCLDLRDDSDPAAFVEEIQRIAQETQIQTVDLVLAAPRNGNGHEKNGVQSFLEDPKGPVGRRWYPVIDYDRCTNCLECIDFCLFGVYGIDEHERILIEQQDNCKKGCPACSRVCPENAIIFPEYKSPAIAGANGEGPAAVKIDLSQLFGGGGASALDLAVRERDQELLADGRETVGASVGIPRRLQQRGPAGPRDDLDDLMDDLEGLEL